MPFWVVKFSVSPLMKPVPTSIVAPVRWPPLSGSLTVRVGSSATAASPPVNVTVPPAVTVGATCKVSSELVPVLLAVTPSLTDQSMVRLVSPAPPVGSALLGLTL